MLMLLYNNIYIYIIIYIVYNICFFICVLWYFKRSCIIAVRITFQHHYNIDLSTILFIHLSMGFSLFTLFKLTFINGPFLGPDVICRQGSASMVAACWLWSLSSMESWTTFQVSHIPPSRTTSCCWLADGTSKKVSRWFKIMFRQNTTDL